MSEPDIEFAPHLAVAPIEASQLVVASLEDFAAVDEPGASALIGDDGEALVPEGGDVMVYGDGGAGKTTLTVDMAFHLAAGDAWLGVTVARPVQVMLVENEGPRPLFRKKLRRKLEAWTGGSVAGRLHVVERPWASFTFADEDWREALANEIARLQIGVVIVGPVTRAGMNEAGTLQDVRDFMLLASDVRRRAGRPVTFVPIHHENKGGQVSGAWEGAVDTLLHVQGLGHGRTKLFIQKARWSTSHHHTSLHLRWAPGDGFEVEDEPTLDDNDIATELLAVVLADGGKSWRTYEGLVKGKGERVRAIRDRLLSERLLINAGSGSRMELWNREDPLCPERDTLWDTGVSATGEAGQSATVSPCPDVKGTRDTGTHSGSPDDRELERLADIGRGMGIA